ncbi:MAG: pilin [Gammaproteobacteria bacterium]
MNAQRKQEGFNLIELMIVVAIIAVLAAIAVPLYLTFVARAQSTSALSLAEAFKPAAVEYYSAHGTWAGVRQNSTIGMPEPASFAGKYVKSVHVVGESDVFQIIAIYCTSDGDPGCAVNKALQGQYLMLEAWHNSAKSGTIQWLCVVNSSDLYQYVPAKCRHTSIY